MSGCRRGCASLGVARSPASTALTRFNDLDEEFARNVAGFLLHEYSGVAANTPQRLDAGASGEGDVLAALPDSLEDIVVVLSLCIDDESGGQLLPRLGNSSKRQ
jgi:hypothetical protein